MDTIFPTRPGKRDLIESHHSPLARLTPPDKSLIAVQCDLVKARLTFLVGLLTTSSRFYRSALRGATD